MFDIDETNINKTRFIGKDYKSNLDVVFFLEDIVSIQELEAIVDPQIPKRTRVDLYNGSFFILNFQSGCELIGQLSC